MSSKVGCQFDMLNDDMPYDLSLSRRDLIRTAAALPLAAAGANAAAVDAASGFHLGIASYTLRTLTRTKAIAALKDLDIKYVSIKDFHAKIFCRYRLNQPCNQHYYQLVCTGIPIRICQRLFAFI